MASVQVGGNCAPFACHSMKRVAPMCPRRSDMTARCGLAPHEVLQRGTVGPGAERPELQAQEAREERIADDALARLQLRADRLHVTEERRQLAKARERKVGEHHEVVVLGPNGG